MYDYARAAACSSGEVGLMRPAVLIFEFGQDLRGMLAEHRRRPRVHLPCSIDPDRPSHEGQRPFDRMRLVVKGAKTPHLRVLEHLVHCLHRRIWDVGTLQARHPVQPVTPAGQKSRALGLRSQTVPYTASPAIAHDSKGSIIYSRSPSTQDAPQIGQGRAAAYT